MTPQRIFVICSECGKPGYVWDVLMTGPADEHVCATCKHPAKVDPDAPIKTVRIADPERKLHNRRRTGQRAARHVGRG